MRGNRRPTVAWQQNGWARRRSRASAASQGCLGGASLYAKAIPCAKELRPAGAPRVRDAFRLGRTGRPWPWRRRRTSSGAMSHTVDTPLSAHAPSRSWRGHGECPEPCETTWSTLRSRRRNRSCPEGSCPSQLCHSRNALYPATAAAVSCSLQPLGKLQPSHQPHIFFPRLLA